MEERNDLPKNQKFGKLKRRPISHASTEKREGDSHIIHESIHSDITPKTDPPGSNPKKHMGEMPESKSLESPPIAQAASKNTDQPPRKPKIKKQGEGRQPAKHKKTGETLRDWLMITIGLVLIVFAALNLFKANPISMLRQMRATPPVDQAGFAPIFIPRTSAVEVHPEEVSASPFIPDRIVIDQIGLDAPVKIAQFINVTVDDQEATQFLVPEEFAAGWHEGSAPLGVPGNTVISGHHNAYGEVFKDLVDLESGDRVTMLSGTNVFEYVIINKMILSEKNEPLEVRVENARWILTSDDERLTLVTCWPQNSNTHRLILVAIPLKSENLSPTVEPTRAPGISRFQNTPALVEFSGPMSIPTADRQPQQFSILNTGRFSVNIRETPGTKGEIIGSLRSGHSAIGLERTTLGDWILIKTDEVSGWVSAELVEARTPIEILPTTRPSTSTP